MCEPTTLLIGAGLAISAGSAVAGHSAQNKAEKANREAAEKAQKEAVRDINLLQSEIGQQASQQVAEGERIGQQVRGATRASGTEAGVEGRGVDELIDEVDRNIAAARIATQRQTALQKAGLEREKVSGRTVMQQRIGSVPRANPFATALQIGGAATGAYLNYRTLTDTGE